MSGDLPVHRWNGDPDTDRSGVRCTGRGEANLLSRDGTAVLIEGFLAPEAADEHLATLIASLPWVRAGSIWTPR